MNSTVNLYRTRLLPEKNAVLDDIEDYLESTDHSSRITIENFQYVKHGLDITIKVDMNQTATNFATFNYCSIENIDDNKKFYYFILDRNWKSQNTVELVLSQDTLNTWKYRLQFDPRTKILRQHENRFELAGPVSTYSTVLNRKISRTEEAVNNVATELYSDETITANDNNKWYLVYQSSTAVESTTAINPIDCYLVPKNHVPVATYATSSSIIGVLDIPQSKYFMWVKSENPNTTTISGYDFSIPLDRNDIVYFYRTTEDKLMVIFVNSLGTRITIDAGGVLIFNNLTQVRYNTKQSLDGSTVMTWTGGYRYSKYYDLINKTDTKILKIIECPYCPVEYVINSDGTYGFGIAFDISATGDIKLIDSSLEFEKVVCDSDLDNMTVRIPTKSQRWDHEPLTTYESKLYNSNFNNLVYQYDSESIAIRREAIVPGSSDPAEIVVKYKQANTITSNLLFDATINNAIYDKNSVYELLMTSTRNNEMPLYNSSYLNYLRTGYNYDLKTRKLQTEANIAGIAINTAGTVASLATFGLTGGAGGKGISAAAGISGVQGVASGLTNTIISWANTTNQIRQKKAELKQQAVNVSGSDDLNLLNYYNGNKVHKLTYTVPDKLKYLLFDLFRLTGYACETSGIPDTSSRRWFNYVQCEPVFASENNADWAEYIDDIKTRFAAGATYYHAARTSANGEFEYDLEQKYENFETQICER